MKSFLPILFIGFLAGCATSLTRDGQKVEILRSLPVGQENQFEHMGIITCQNEQNLASVETNRESCANKLRNRAAEKGADLVVIESEDTFPGTATVGVSMVGITYRKRSSF